MVIAGVGRIMGRGSFWVSVVLAVAVLALLSLASRAGAQQPTVRLEVPSLDEQVGDAPFPVDVVVEDVANLGAFEFELVFDPAVLSYGSVIEGPFLGSSGRLVQCLDPTIEPASVLFRCVTLGPVPPGADGSGTLATITFELVGSGTSPLRFEVLTLAEPDAQRIQAVSEDGVIAFDPAGIVVTPVPTPTPTPTPSMEAADATATEAVSMAGTPSSESPPSSASNDSGGANWALWGSLIGAAVVLVVAAAGAAWWYRARRPS